MVTISPAFSKYGLTDEYRNKANYLVLQHADGTFTLCVHLPHNDMDLQAAPEIARLISDPASSNTANEAMQIWWALYSLP
jgi:hypothetical protein